MIRKSVQRESKNLIYKFQSHSSWKKSRNTVYTQLSNKTQLAAHNSAKSRFSFFALANAAAIPRRKIQFSTLKAFYLVWRRCKMKLASEWIKDQWRPAANWKRSALTQSLMSCHLPWRANCPPPTIASRNGVSVCVRSSFYIRRSLGWPTGGPLERNQSQQSNKPHNRDHNAEDSLALLAYKMMCQAGSGLYPPAKSDEPASQRIVVMDRAVDSQHKCKYSSLVDSNIVLELVFLSSYSFGSSKFLKFALTNALGIKSSKVNIFKKLYFIGKYFECKDLIL